MVIGYYTLSATRIEADKLPPDLAKKLPTGEVIPGTLLGRLAVDQRYRGQHVGQMLLMDALARAVANSKQVASFAVVLDAKTEESRSFFMRYDFLAFADDAHKLFLPMKKIEPLFSA
jgi:predicted GNAT family N-acyltransferase